MTATSTHIPTEITALLDRLDPQLHNTCHVEGCIHFPALATQDGATS